MLYQWSILLLSIMQYGLTSENFDEIKLCKDKILTLSLSRFVQFRRAVVISDPFPARGKTTCNIRVDFDAAATVDLMLTTVNIWNTMNPSNGTQGYELQNFNGEIKIVPRNFMSEGSSAWTNTSSTTCPYLHVWRASAPKSDDAVQSIFNESTTLNATGIVIALRNIPETAWCDIRISINASLMPEDYCRAKEQLYCNSSAQCLNASLLCDGYPHCDNGEDEVNCSEEVADGFTEDFIAEGFPVYLSITICVVILLMTAVLAVLCRLWHARLRRKKDNSDNPNNHQAGASVTESTRLSYLIDNDMYSSSP